MIRINLIPVEYLEKQKRKTQILRAAGVGIIIVFVIFLLTLMHIRQAMRMEFVLSQKEGQLKVLQAKVDKVNELESIKASVKAHLDSLTGLLAARYYYPHFMQDIVKSLPPTVWLGSLSTLLQQGGKIEFNTSAMARTGEDVAAWLNTLETDKKFADPQLGGISISESNGMTTYAFPVKAAYMAAQPPQQ